MMSLRGPRESWGELWTDHLFGWDDSGRASSIGGLAIDD